MRIAVGVYALLWLLTATWGNLDVDKRFDHDFRHGFEGGLLDRPTEIVRIRRFHVRDLFDPRNEALMPENLRFCYRSRGIAIAPFVIIDNIGTVYASLGGVGATRVNVWFFGCTKWWVIKAYWHV